MQPAGATIKKIFADTLRKGGEDDAPLLAWPLACGSRVAEKTSATSYADGVLTVEVSDSTWQQQLQALERQYIAALQPISAQPVNAIKFVVRGQRERGAAGAAVFKSERRRAKGEKRKTKSERRRAKS